MRRYETRKKPNRELLEGKESLIKASMALVLTNEDLDRIEFYKNKKDKKTPAISIDTHGLCYNSIMKQVQRNG